MSGGAVGAILVVGGVVNFLIGALLTLEHSLRQDEAEWKQLARALLWEIWLLSLAARAVGAYVGRQVGEAGRLNRELRRLEKERHLLKLRGKVERERLAYQREFDRYIGGES